MAKIQVMIPTDMSWQGELYPQGVCEVEDENFLKALGIDPKKAKEGINELSSEVALRESPDTQPQKSVKA